MSKSLGRVFGIGEESPYGYETDYMQYLSGYNPFDYEQTLQNVMASAVNANTRPPYQIQENHNTAPSYSEPTKVYSPSNSPADMLYKDWQITNKFLNRLKQNAAEDASSANFQVADNDTPDFSKLNNTPLSMGLTAMPEQTPMRNLNTEIINNREIVETPYSNNILENDCYQSERFEPFARQVRWNEGENQGITYATPETTKTDQPTKYGISQDTLNRYRKKYQNIVQTYPENVKDLTEEQAMNLLCQYYKESRAEAINDANLAFAHYDSFVNAPNGSAKDWQKALNDLHKSQIQIGGGVGSETVNSFNNVDTDEKRRRLYEFYIKHHIPKVGDKYKRGIGNCIKRYR